MRQSIDAYVVRFIASFKYADPRQTRVFLGSACLLWSFVLSLPGDSLAVSSWDVLRKYGGGETTVAIVPGLFGMLSLMGDIMGSARLRIFSSTVIAIWWSFVFLSLSVVRPVSTGTAVYGLMVVFSFWLVYRDKGTTKL